MAILVNFVPPGDRRAVGVGCLCGVIALVPILANGCCEDAHNPEVFPSGVLLLMNPLVPSPHLHWSQSVHTPHLEKCYLVHAVHASGC